MRTAGLQRCPVFQGLDLRIQYALDSVDGWSGINMVLLKDSLRAMCKLRWPDHVLTTVLKESGLG